VKGGIQIEVMSDILEEPIVILTTVWVVAKVRNCW